MFLRWRNGVLSVGRVWTTGGLGVELAWNRREDLGDAPSEGEIAFADYVCLDWSPGRWLPRYTRLALKLKT